MSTTRLFAQLTALGHGGLTDLPLFHAVRGLGDVIDVREVWRGGAGEVDILGSVRLSEEIVIPVGSLDIAVGSSEITAPFAVTLDAGTVELILLVRCVQAGLIDLNDAETLGKRLSGVDTTHPHKLATALSDILTTSVSELPNLRVAIGPLTARVDLPSDWLTRVRPLTDQAGQTVGFEEIQQAPPPWIPLGQVSLLVSAAGIDIDLDVANHVDIPPVMIADTGIVVAMEGVVWHHSGPPPTDLTDHALPPNWHGLIIGNVTVWGLDKILPGAPGGRADGPTGAMRLNDWIIDREGIRGRLSLDFSPQPGLIAVQRLDLAFDRSWWPTELAMRVIVDIGTILGDESHRITASADLLVNPQGSSSERWALNLIADATDGPLASIVRGGLAGIGTAAAALAAAGEGDAAIMAGAIAALESSGLGHITGAAIDHLSGRVQPVLTPGTGSRELRAEISIGARLILELTLPDGTVELELGIGHLTALATLSAEGPPHIRSDWTLSDGLDVTLPTTVDLAGLLVINAVGLRRSPDGLVIEFGVESSGTGDVALAGFPDAIIVTYRPTGNPTIDVAITRSASPMSILIPGVLYASGSLSHEPNVAPPFSIGQWGQVRRGTLSAFLIGNGTARSADDHLRKSAYAFDLEIGVVTATRDDGLQAVILTLDAGFRPGLPLGTSGASLYELGLTFAMNGAPTAAGGDYASWFLEAPPAYSTGIEKWRPEAGGWAFGASATLGSSPDDGRSWNAGVGLFLLLPGPVVLITGEGNLFSALPSLPAQGGDPDALSFGFGAVLTLDFGRHFFGASFHGMLEKTAGEATLVRATIPADISIDLDDPTNFTLAIGRPEPPADRVQINLLGMFDASSYLLLSGTDVLLPGVEPPLTLPGLALAFGAAGGFDRRLKAGPARVVLWARAGFDVGLSLSLPLAAGRVYLEGGLDVSVYGVGLSLEAALNLVAMAPDPFMLTGSARVRIGLPWPLPDINASATIELAPTREWVFDAPRPDAPVETLTLWGAGTGAPTVLKPGETGSGIPLDVLAEIVFSAPVGNDTPTIGCAATDGDDADAPVWEVATAETDEDGFERRHGYRHVVSSVTVTRTTPHGAVPEEDIPAFWPGGTAIGAVRGLHSDVPRTAGGMPARTSLRLWQLGDLAAARVGNGAEIVARWAQTWDPCAQPDDDEKSLQRLYTARSLTARLTEQAFVPPVTGPGTWPIRRPFPLPFGEDRTPGDWSHSLSRAAEKALTRFDSLPHISRLNESGRTMINIDEVVELLPGTRGSARRERGWERTRSREERMSEPSFAPLRHVVASRLGLQTDRRSATDRVWELAPGGLLPPWWSRRLATAPMPADDVAILPNDTPPDDVVARARAESPPATGSTMARLLDAEVEPARIARNPASINVPLLTPIEADEPVFALPRLILPTMPAGAEERLAALAVETVGRLRIDLTDTEQATAILLAAPGVHVIAWQTGADGQERRIENVATTDVHIGDRRVWRRVRFTSIGPVIALRFAAVHGPLKVQVTDEAAVAALTSVECFPLPRNEHAARDRHRTATDTAVRLLRDAAQTWQGESGTPAGILSPDTDYEIVVAGTSEAVTLGRSGLEKGSAQWSWERRFTFTTTSALAGRLRAYPDEAPHEGRVAEDGSRESDWEVATSPGDGSTAYYTAEPLLVRLRDARTVAVADALNFDLRVRLVDERGVVTEHLNEVSLTDPTDVDAHIAALRERLGEFPCVADSRGGEIWREARIALPDLLAPRTRYVATLQAVPRGGGPAVELHSWRFRTSAHRDPAAHLSAHTIVDVLIPDPDGIIARVGAAAPGGIVIDDATFDEWLIDRCGFPASPAPQNCELARLWAWDPATDGVVCIGLLLDGDEPLLRGSRSGLATGRAQIVVRQGGSEIALTAFTGVSTSRVLLLPATPNLPGTIEIALRSHPNARIAVPIPAVPDNLDGAL
ncbi:hypothetical protein [Flaviflexus huanghaiensis]|uniref:hypothetical protein n=1 Tax=Flaviflexus huanghaiensis TaxID=1111473 RepID=UPI0015FC2710|nr:hypothetical protein [Flaviflexus huanghaiensis]